MDLRVPNQLPVPMSTMVQADAHDACGVSNPWRVVEDFIQAQQAIGATPTEALVSAVGVYGACAARSAWHRVLSEALTGPDLLGALDGIAQVDPVAANAWLNDALRRGLFPAWQTVTRGDGCYLEERPWITTLPDALEVEGELDLQRASVTCLPQNFRVGSHLCLAHCTSLASLPDGLVVGGYLELLGCDALVELPDDLRVEGSIYLEKCVSLVKLPKGLKVGGQLDLWGCVALKALPEGLSVAYDLDLKGCASWDGIIPDDAIVKGKVSTNQHPEGIALSAWRELHPRGEFFK